MSIWPVRISEWYPVGHEYYFEASTMVENYRSDF